MRMLCSVEKFSLKYCNKLQQYCHLSNKVEYINHMPDFLCSLFDQEMPPKLLFPLEDPGSRLLHGCLGPLKSIPVMAASRSVQLFWHSSRMCDKQLTSRLLLCRNISSIFVVIVHCFVLFLFLYNRHWLYFESLRQVYYILLGKFVKLYTSSVMLSN